MMKGTVSNTMLAHREIIKFWSDNSPHSLQEFREYLDENYMEMIEEPHISSAVYHAQQKEELERVERGVYRAGKNLGRNGKTYGEEKNDMAVMLRKVQKDFSLPVNLIHLNPKERELIPRMQELYQECGRLLDELESEDEGDEVSE